MSAPMPSLAETMDALPLHLARPWPDGVPTSPSEGTCDSCMWPMAGDRVWHNGGWCHARCAAACERLILGPSAGPGLAEHLDHLDALRAFLKRLADVADRHGIARDRLGDAIAEAWR